MEQPSILSDLSIGERLRDRRRELGLTMQQVADAAGLSVGFISQVERDITAPSLSSLMSILKVLNVSLGQFLERPRNAPQVNSDGEPAVCGLADGHAVYEQISENFEGSVLSSVIVREPPGHRGAPSSNFGEELMYVLSGELTTEVDGRRRVIRAGDSIHFPSSLAHATWNHTTETTVFLWCGTRDVAGRDGTDPIHRRSRKG